VNLIVNGNFDVALGVIPWTVTSAGTNTQCNYQPYNSDGTGVGYNFKDNGPASCAYEQTISVVPGQVYELSFSYNPQNYINNNFIFEVNTGNGYQSISVSQPVAQVYNQIVLDFTPNSSQVNLGIRVILGPGSTSAVFGYIYFGFGYVSVFQKLN